MFTSGGRGPTHHELTMAGIAQSFGTRIVREEELVEFGALQQKLDQASRTSAILLTIAILLMAISRYLVF